MKKNLIALLAAVAMLASTSAVFADATPAPAATDAETVEVTADTTEATELAEDAAEATDDAAEAADAAETEEATDDVMDAVANYMVYAVTVTEVTENGLATTTVEEDAENPENTINFNVTENTIALGYANGEVKDVKDIKAGDRITVYTNANAPAPLILPPLYSADVIFVEDNLEIDSLRMADVDTYAVNEEEMLVNAANTLALNIDETTVIVDREGNAVEAAELDKKNLAVIYSTSTRSIPAQTTPIKVVVLGENEAPADDVQEPEATAAPEVYTLPASITVADKTITNIYEKDEVTMVPLREVAETLGFTVDWDGETKSVILNSGMYTMQIGVNSYVKGKMVPMTLVCAPEITNDLTFVPAEYITEVLEQTVTMNYAD